MSQPAEKDATIYVPLRGGDLNLTANDGPDEDGYVTLSDDASDVHLTLPADLLDRLAKAGDVVMVVRVFPPGVGQADAGQ